MLQLVTILKEHQQVTRLDADSGTLNGCAVSGSNGSVVKWLEK